jgi:hypothetical protein
MMIIENALQKINRYNQLCLHYNMVAEGIYKARDTQEDLFGTSFLPYLVAGLISFDLGRMMGKGAEGKYDPEGNGFASQLMNKLQKIRPHLQHLTHLRLSDINLLQESGNITAAYRCLSSAGRGCLNQNGDEFHVGATKIMLFINPELFIIVDSNSARALRMAHYVGYRNTTQPGYCDTNYIQSLKYAQTDINAFGVNEFCSLENGMPMARIYDKLAFAVGAEWP